MNLRTAIATATTAAVLATSGVALAGAASNSSTPPASTSVSTAPPATPAAVTPRLRPAARLRLRALVRRGAAAVITKTIGIDRKTLRADLLAGQTIAQIAGTKGVTADTVIAALVTAATDKLNAAVQAGKIKQARATKIEAKLPAKVATLVNTWHPKRAQTTAP